MNDKISIIVPIYNAAKYLPKCIESILNQTHKDLEIILVDDGSTDESGKIADEYSKKDGRIKVIHKEHGGNTEGRNMALKVASGKFIGFVDHDDFIETDMYEILLSALHKYDADIVQCAHYKINEKNKIFPRYYSGKTREFDNISALEELITRKSFKNSLWNKIYKKNLIDGIIFPAGRLNKDILFNYKAFARAKKLVSIDIPKYYYLMHKESMSGSYVHLEEMDKFRNLIERLDFISRNFSQLFNIAHKEMYFDSLRLYKIIKINQSKDKDNKRRNLIKNYISENYKSFISNQLITGTHKLLLKVLMKNFEFGFFLFDLYSNFEKKKNRHRFSSKKASLKT
jgi:glycosyltransferase involved in cell wall biosynthesis